MIAHAPGKVAAAARRPASRLLALLLAVSLPAGCSRDSAPVGQRVVSVSKQINEFIYDIGAQRDLVARDLTSVYPPAIRQLPSVGYHRALSAEGIVSMHPTLFLTDGNVGPESVLEQLRRVGVPVLVLRPGATLDSAQLLMRELGRVFHRQRAADTVIAAWRAGMDSVLRDTLATGVQRPRVLVMHFGQIVNDYLAVGPNGPASDMLRWAGGRNAVDSGGPMTRLTPELIARVAPDIIIATDVGFDRVGSAGNFARLPGVALTPAGKARRIYRIDETELLYFGPRTPTTIRRLRSVLQPQPRQ